MNQIQFPKNDPNALFGRIRYVHGDKEGLGTAFDLVESSSIRILFPRVFGVSSVSCEIFNEGLTLQKATVNGDFYGLEGEFDVFEIPLDLDLFGVGIYFFKLSVYIGSNLLWGFKDEDRILLKDDNSGEYFQLSVYHFSTKAPENKYGGIIYHIFVDRFNRGGTTVPKPGAQIIDDWRYGVPEYPAYNGAPLKNNTFYGGTLHGITDKLDYIASLGVDTIYLSPIFDSPSNHKYDTSDYMRIDPMFGTEDDLIKLINEGKKRGIGIILDGVFNHTGADSVYFNRYGNYSSLGAYQSCDSPYFDWFEFQNHPDTYTCWWGIEILPRINPDIPSCREYFVGKDGVIDKYSKLGIDGFRLDVVDELSDSFIRDIKRVMDSNNPTSILYGEVWEDGSNKIAYGKRKQYYLGRELDGVMNYPIRSGIIEYLTMKKTDKLRYALTDVINNAPERVRNLQMNLIGSHDTIRILTALGGESPEGRSNEYLRGCRMSDVERGRAKRLLRMAYTVLATLPGIPSIYYGDEAGLEGYSDPFNRMPYPHGQEDFNLIEFYKRIGHIRRTESVYKKGDFKLLHLDRELLIFSRIGEDNSSILTVLNNSKENVLLRFSDDISLLDLNGNGTVNELREIRLEALTSQLIKCKNSCLIDV